MNTQELRDAFAQLPPMEGVPKPHTWDRHRYELRRHVAKDDPEKFLQWSTIQATMFVGDAPYVTDEFISIAEKHDDLYAAIQETEFGDAPCLPNASWTSGNLVHQATHLRIFIETLWPFHPKDFSNIVEFGGGYGAMALIISRLGFKGDYTLIDLPELRLLQEYYLSNVGVSANHVDLLHYLSPFDEFHPCEPDLFIACYSISEAPQKVRDFVFDRVKARYYLLAIQEIYAGLNLKEEFRRITEKMDDVQWTWIQNPYFHRHSYIIGERV